jgi:polar amino acid transport system substrate-binding protein
MTRARWCWLVIALAAVLAAGCGSSSDKPERMTLAALSIKAPSAPAPTPSPPDVPCTHVTASLRPPAAMPTPGAMPAGSFMAKIKRRGYLIAGVDQNTLRFAYFNPLTGQIEGFEIDLLRQLAKAIFGDPDRIKFKAVTTDERVTAVQNGSVDVVADAMTITCQRRRQVDFSTVYYDAGQKVLVPSDSPARNVGDLGGKRVCVTRGSTSLQTLERQRPRPIAYPVDQRTDCLVALQEGRVAAVTSDDSILLGFEAQDPDTKIVGPRFANEPYGMAISKAHPDFVRFVNGVLAQLRADGTWRSIYRRWLGGLTPGIPAPPAATYESSR